MAGTGRSLTDRQVGELAESLMGTANSLNSTVETLFGLDPDELTVADCKALDDRVLLCDCCGWWCGSEEMAERDLCEECAEEEE